MEIRVIKDPATACGPNGLKVPMINSGDAKIEGSHCNNPEPPGCDM